jgi:CheY-like chemotaxis protein
LSDNKKPLARLLLIVDDDPEIVQVLKMDLLKNEFMVEAFTNLQQALQTPSIQKSSERSDDQFRCLNL